MTFEFLPRLWRALELQSNSGTLFGYWLAFWTRAVAPDRLPEYLGWLDRISLRCIELLGPLGAPFEVGLILKMALSAIHGADRERFRSVLESLKRQCSGGDGDKRRAMLADIERQLTRPGPPPPM